MKRRTGKAGFAAALAVTAMLAALPVYAADTTQQSGELGLSLSKDAEYLLTIPKSPEAVEFGIETAAIGDLVVSGNIGMKEKVTVTAEKEDFKAETDAANTISFALKNGADEFKSAEWVRTDMQASPEGSKKIPLTVKIPAAAWNTAAPGTYKGKIIFKAVLSNLDSEGQPGVS